jgi:hypothetical protein
MSHNGLFSGPDFDVTLTPCRVDFFGLNDGAMEGVDLTMHWQKEG